MLYDENVNTMASETKLKSRLDSLLSWCNKVGMSAEPILRCDDLTVLSGDASNRRYFRANNQIKSRKLPGSYVAVDAVPDKENNERFVVIAKDWSAQGLRTPKVFGVNLDDGFMLLEDFGDDTLFSHLNDANVDQYYDQTLSVLHKIQGLMVTPELKLQTYNKSVLLREMELFKEWFVVKLLGIELSSNEDKLVVDLFDHLVDSALQQPQVVVHRDYHSRNLMLLAEDGIGILDFQDAILGPVTYDAVSLLRDCYIDWPQKKVYEWLDNFQAGSSILSSFSNYAVKQWFDLIGLQRHIKVLGIFSRLWLRDSKKSYLSDIPRVFSYLVNVAKHYEEFHDFVYWLEVCLVPKLEKQDWWYKHKLLE